MSWSIERTSDNNDSFQRLNTAIKKAADADTIMYCSARDKGEEENKSIRPYPAASDTLKLKRVGGALPSGEKGTWTNVGAVDYLLPGVFSLQKESSSEIATSGSLDSFDGSSAATALAAGLAALVLLCFEAVHQDLARFKNPELIDALFRALQNSPSKYIQVSRLLDEGLHPHDTPEDAVRKVIEECKSLARSAGAKFPGPTKK